MSCINPTGGGDAIRLKIPAGNLPFLRRVFGALVEGIKDDLDNHRRELRQPQTSLLMEQRVYGWLLAAVETGSADRGHLPAMRGVLKGVSEIIDAGNEYDRVVFEHDALAGLVRQLEGRGS